MKSILLIGVGEIGLNQIRWAREAGYHVVVTDRDPAAPSLGLADHAVQISGSEVAAMTDWALDHQAQLNITAVYSGNDLGVNAATAVARALGIEGNTLEAVGNGLDKSRMKCCWLADGVPTPEHGVAENRKQAEDLVHRFGLPVMIKPQGSSGSQGIQILEDLASLDGALAEAKKFSTDKGILVEKFVEGRHIDGNAFFFDGVFYPCGLSERHFSPAPFRVPLGGYEPVTFSLAQKAEIHRIFEAAARSLGLTHGPVKGDFILGSDGLQVIEVSPRFHGDVGTSHTTFYRTGSSHLQIYFEALFSGRVPEDKLNALEADTTVCGWRVFDLEPGRITNLDQAAALAGRQAGVTGFFVRPRGPRQIVTLTNNTQVAGFVWQVGSDQEEVDRALDNFLSCLRENVEY